MNFQFKIILVCISILICCPSFAQLVVKSDFNRGEGQLNIELINKSPYMILFMREHLLNPPYISIESYDSEDDRIEWLKYPSLGHDGSNFLNDMSLYLKQNESYPLSFNIKPDKMKRIPKYFIVTYYLLLRKLNIENIDGTLSQQFKHSMGVEIYHFKERFEYEMENGDNKPISD